MFDSQTQESKPEDIFSPIDKQETPVMQAALAPDTGKGKKWLLVGGIAAVVIAVVGAVTYILSRLETQTNLKLSTPIIQTPETATPKESVASSEPPPSPLLEQEKIVGDAPFGQVPPLPSEENLPPLNPGETKEDVTASAPGSDVPRCIGLFFSEVSIPPDDAKDSDGDGLIDRDEVNIYRTNPCKTDTDDDTFSDFTELCNGFDPLEKFARLSENTPRPDNCSAR